MMAHSGSDDDEEAVNTNYALGRAARVAIMTGVAANDALIAVMARTMKEIHFSVIMFWFSFVGFVLLLSAMVA